MNYEKALLILELKPNYTQDELRKSYRRLSKKYHPDVQGGSERKFEHLKEAYNLLCLNKGQETAIHNRNKPRGIYHGKSLFDYILK